MYVYLSNYDKYILLSFHFNASLLQNKWSNIFDIQDCWVSESEESLSLHWKHTAMIAAIVWPLFWELLLWANLCIFCGCEILQTYLPDVLPLPLQNHFLQEMHCTTDAGSWMPQ